MNRPRTRWNDLIFSCLAFVLILVGVALISYPALSNYWNEAHQSRMIEDYATAVTGIGQYEAQKLFLESKRYNERLYKKTGGSLLLENKEDSEYNSLLDISGTGIMGYISIPDIHVKLPIYHGTSESVMQVAVGHIQGSSLPVGGENTHAALIGHCGLPSAKLFTNLNKLKEGDCFSIHILDQVLTYEVDQIEIVLPKDLSLLSVEDGQDHVTLITCTPYGVNSHRLLVRGKRITETGIQHETQDAVTADNSSDTAMPVIYAVCIVFLLAVVFLVFMIRHSRRI